MKKPFSQACENNKDPILAVLKRVFTTARDGGSADNIRTTAWRQEVEQRREQLSNNYLPTARDDLHGSTNVAGAWTSVPPCGVSAGATGGSADNVRTTAWRQEVEQRREQLSNNYLPTARDDLHGSTNVAGAESTGATGGSADNVGAVICPCEVLEIGSGTGQHAVYFAEHLPHLTWQPTDQEVYLPGISLWVEEAKLENIKTPMPLDINDDPWPFRDIEAVFTANTLHIMGWEDVEIFYERLGRYLRPGARFLSYGPFNINGTYTSESNARFDCWLKEQDPKSAIRDMGALETLGKKASITLLEKVPMPANNFTLIWRKQ